MANLAATTVTGNLDVTGQLAQQQYGDSRY